TIYYNRRLRAKVQPGLAILHLAAGTRAQCTARRASAGNINNTGQRYSMAPLLEVKNLVTRFYTEQGVVNAVNGISYRLAEGESLGIVGESGSGKSVGVMSLIGLIPSPPGRVENGEVNFHGRDLLKLRPAELRHVRGREITMIF